MKRVTSLMVALAFALTLAAFAQESMEAKKDEMAPAAASEASDVLKTDKEKASYAIGLQIGESLKMLKDSVDLPSLIRGLEDKFQDKEPLLDNQQAEKVMQEFSEKVRAEQQAKQQKEGEENLKAGEAFLEENKKKEGVKVTDSGLQYKVIEEGDGPKPTAEDTVKINYRGTFIDGTEFDSSYDKGEPITLPLNRVIPGWTEGLQMMKVGSKWELYIPANLAYGPHGRPPKIAPNATLVFEVELLDIEKPQDEEMVKEPATEGETKAIESKD